MDTPPRPAAARGGAAPRARIAWCLYDWANSGFATVILTFVFATYFAQAVAESPVLGQAQWGQALALSGLAVALASPLFGALADRTGPRKPWLAGLSAVCIVATALLWFARPDPAFVLWSLIFFAVANTAFEMAMVFYNAMLPDIAPRGGIGRLSGWAWGVGYLGGLVCLAAALLAFVQTDAPAFGLDKDSAEHVRATGPMVAIWFALFAAPLFLFVPDAPPTGVGRARAVREAAQTLLGTLRNIRRYANIGRFLLARLFYIDGLNTMFAFGGIYAAGTFGMSLAEIIQFGIALNVTAGLGAAAFAWVDDWIGAKRTILIALVGLIALGVPLLLAESKSMFWALALPLGLFMGPAQAASRSLMARLAPEDMRSEMFGLFALSGKITAFLGPAILAWVTLAYDSQRAGMATVIAFLLIGLALLLSVREPPPETAG